MLDARARRILLETGLRSVQHGLRAREPGSLPQELRAAFYPHTVHELRSCFVTLRRQQELRGCCGALEARRPLIEDVWHNAYAAAFLDPRFSPLDEAEFADLELTLSILTPLERLYVGSRAELLERLRPGRDGLALAWRGTRATFIPHVWDGVPDAREFLRQLMRKAGWPEQFWAPDLEVWRYEAESIP